MEGKEGVSSEPNMWDVHSHPALGGVKKHPERENPEGTGRKALLHSSLGSKTEPTGGQHPERRSLGKSQQQRL